jgi:hypothetical protein
MNKRLMDPAEFRERMNDSFGSEPLHAPAGDDVRRGRTRLRRQRAVTSLAALAAVGVVGTGVAMMPTPSTDRPAEVGPAAQPELTAAEILSRCTTGENAFFLDGTGQKVEGAAVRLLGENPGLMTSAVTDNRTHATLRSEDGRYWGSCQFRNEPDNGVKNDLTVYPTAVDFPRRTLAGVRAYQRADEADPRFAGGADSPVPHLEVPCVSPLTGEQRWSVDAQCPQFTMTWNDRRPVEVSAVKVVTPDGESSWADVGEGYLSFAYTGDMSPEIAEQVARGEAPGARRVVFYDADGEVLVDDRDPGRPPGPGELSILDFPSLAWWLR